MNDADEKTESAASPGPGTMPPALPRLERIAYLILNNRALSLQAAGRALDTVEEEGPAAVEAETLRLALRFAEEENLVTEGMGARPEGSREVAIREEAGPAVRSLVLSLDPYSRALLISLVALDHPYVVTTDILGLHPDSLAVNLRSLLSKLRGDAADAHPRGCGDPAFDAVEKTALGIASGDEEAEASRHLASPCSACADARAFLAREKETLKSILEVLLVPDLEEASFPGAMEIMDGEKEKPPFNLARFLGLSKESCMGVAMIGGLVGAVLLYVMLEWVWGGGTLDSLVPWSEPASSPKAASTPAPGASSAPDAGPTGPSMTLARALEDLGQGGSRGLAARGFFLQTWRETLPALLQEKRKRPALQGEIEGLLMAIAEDKLRGAERDLAASLQTLEARARKRAFDAYEKVERERRELDARIRERKSELEKKRKAGANASEIAAVKKALLLDEVRRGRLEGMDLEMLAALIERDLQAETRAQGDRLSARRRALTPAAAEAILTGAEPRFPWRVMADLQEAIRLPALSGDPVPAPRAASLLSAWVDVPVILDPGALPPDGEVLVDLTRRDTTVREALERFREALGGRDVHHGGAVFLTRPGRDRPADLLRHLAGFLRSGDPARREAAAWGFEALTRKRFGFQIDRPVDSPRNRAAVDDMIRWHERHGTSLVQDPVTGVYALH